MASGTYDGNFSVNPVYTTNTSAASPVSIEAESGASVVIDGQGTGVDLFVGAIFVDVTGITFEGGDGAYGGGGIYNDGTITVTGCTFTGNTTADSGGGGGIANYGNATVVDSSFSGNSAFAGLDGGGIYSSNGDLTVTGSTFADNSVSATSVSGSAEGGGIASFGPTTVTGSTFSGNSATGGGDGGGIVSEVSITITDSTFTNNSVSGSDSSGGALELFGTSAVTGSTFTDNSASGPAISAVQTSVSGGAIFVGGTATITGSTFTGNSASGFEATGGGGVATSGGTSVNITGSSFTANSSDGGGGGGLWNEGTATVSDSTLSGNSATTEQGFQGNGGGIENYGGGTLRLTDSTLSGNSANGGGNGGGIVNDGGGTATVADSTLSGNSAVGGNGGGIWNDAYGTLTLTSSTLSGNSATAVQGLGGDGGGIGSQAGGSGTAMLEADVIADSCYGPFTDSGYNVVAFTSGCPALAVGDSSALVSGDLGSLAANGGPTDTFLPASFYGNPILGVIPDPTLGLCPTVDQRGDSSSGACDAGSVEVPPPPPPLNAPGTPVASAGDGSATVSWAPPTSDGGLPVTSYTVTPTPGCSTCGGLGVSSAGVGQPATVTEVTGLTNGTQYTFTVTATNSAGPGPPSGASNPVTPSGTPALSVSPTAVAFPPTAVGGNAVEQQVTVTDPGPGPLTISAVSVIGGSGAFSVDDSTSTCAAGGELTSGGSCTVDLTFTPGSAQAYTAQLNLGTNAAGGAATLAVTGTGEATAITHVYNVPDQGNPTVVIEGTGFGNSFPAADLGTSTDTGFFELTDATGANKWSDGYTGDGCTATVTEWTDTLIVVQANVDTFFRCALAAGDILGVTVYNASTGIPGVKATGEAVVAAAGPAPSVTNVSPRSGPLGGGTDVVVTGSGFTNARAVLFGSVAATSMTVMSSTEIDVTSPPSALAEGVSVLVIGSDQVPSATDCWPLQSQCATSFFYMQPSETISDVHLAGGVNGSQNVLGVKVTETGSMSMDASATIEESYNGPPSAVLATGSLSNINASLKVDISGKLSGGSDISPLIDVPIPLPGSVPDLISLDFRIVSASLSGSAYLTVNFSQLGLQFSNVGYINGGVTLGTPTLTCAGNVVDLSSIESSLATLNGCMSMSWNATTSLQIDANPLWLSVGGSSPAGTLEAGIGPEVGFGANGTVSGSWSPANGVQQTGTVNYEGCLAFVNANLDASIGTFSENDSGTFGTADIFGNSTKQCPFKTGGTAATTAAGHTYTASTTPADPTVTTTGPTGIVTISPTNVNPAPVDPPGTTGQYFTVSASNAADVGTATITACGQTASQSLSSYDGTSWQAVPPPATPPGPGCLSSTLSATTVPSVADLGAGVIFAVVTTPTVAAVTPTSGATAGGTTVMITGTGMSGATAVAFGAVAASDFICGDTQCAAVSPPATAAGPVHVTVTTPQGVSPVSANDEFSYTPATTTPGVASPVVLGLQPTTGPTGGGTSVVISGTNLSGATAVDFGRTPASSFDVVSAGSITAVSPPNTAGTVDVTVTAAGGTSSATSADEFTYSTPPTRAAAGYWLAAADGGIFTFGDAGFYGSMGGHVLNKPVAGIAAAPGGHGYWEVASDGGVFSFGHAGFYGSMGGKALNKPVVGIAATPGGHGYWEVASDGGIFTFGSAKFCGSTGGTHLNAPVVGVAATPTGNGYWEVAKDGGVFSFGSARFYGSEPGLPASARVAAPVVGIAATPDGKGYWEVTSTGQMLAFGDAHLYGSMAGKPLDKPVAGMASTPDGKGYWLVGADGGIFSFGDARFYGSMAGNALNKPVVGIAAS